MEVCTICAEECEGDGEGHRLECGHLFHPACIVPWFRNESRSCPNCRSEEDNVVFLTPRERVRKMSRRKHLLSSPLRKKVEKFYKVEAEISNLKKERRAHKRENRSIFDRENKLTRSLVKKIRKKDGLLWEIGRTTGETPFL